MPVADVFTLLFNGRCRPTTPESICDLKNTQPSISITKQVHQNFISLNSGYERTIRAKKNIIASFVIKGLSIAIGLILVPLTVQYLNPTKYGIWITLSSIIGWFGMFDIGLGYGLRNRFAEALATGKEKLARVYVSTTYAILSLIIAGLLILFYIINQFINWSVILNAGNDVSFQKELNILALIVFTFFCLSFVFKLITTILTADQHPAKASSFDLSRKNYSTCSNIFFNKNHRRISSIPWHCYE